MCKSTSCLCSIGGSNNGTSSSSVLSDFYGSHTPSVTGSQATALASALVAFEATFTTGSSFRSVISVAATAISKSDLEYLATNTDSVAVVTAKPFFQSLPSDVKSLLIAEQSGVQSVQDSILGTATSKAGAVPTEASSVIVAVVVGVVGAMIAL